MALCLGEPAQDMKDAKPHATTLFTDRTIAPEHRTSDLGVITVYRRPRNQTVLVDVPKTLVVSPWALWQG